MTEPERAAKRLAKKTVEAQKENGDVKRIAEELFIRWVAAYDGEESPDALAEKAIARAKVFAQRAKSWGL